MLFNPFTGSNINAQIKAYMTIHHPTISTSQRISKILDPQGATPMTQTDGSEQGTDAMFFVWDSTSVWGGTKVVDM